jgi:PIN domain nuclease of toxin-antitoxin system
VAIWRGIISSRSQSPSSTRAAGRLEGAHKDPFDRMLAAQALVEGLPLVTNDTVFAAFGVTALWQESRPRSS